MNKIICLIRRLFGKEQKKLPCAMVVPNFITIEQLDTMKQTATGHNY